MKIKYILIIILNCIIYHGQAQINPGKNFDLQGFIETRLSKGQKEILIPPGRHRLKPNGDTHILLENLQDVTIFAENVELICTETIPSIKIVNCKNLKIIGLSIDYDPLPFTQGRIVEMSEDKTKLTVDILDGYTTNLRNEKLEIYDAQTSELVTRTYYSVKFEIDDKKRRVVFSKKPQADPIYSFEKVGDIVVFDTFNKRFVPHCILMEGCEGLQLENITVYAGPTFAYFEKSCNGTKYLGCKVDRRPLESDIVQRGVKRMRSNNADGFHSKSAQIGPIYRNCLVRYNGDDGFAISGQYHVVTGTYKNLLTVVGKGGKGIDIIAGDQVELVSYDGNRLKDALVKSIKKARELNAEEKQFLQTQKFLAEASQTQNAQFVYLIEIDREVELPLGSVIASSNRLGNGFEISNCTAGPNRSRGIIAKASNGTISNNKLISNWGIGIKCSPEHHWLEGGSSNNLTITDNIIENCHDVGISVYAIGGNGKVASENAHSNISISRNKVSGSLNPAYAVTSTTGLLFMENTVSTPNNSFGEPWRVEFGRKQDVNRTIYFEKVRNFSQSNSVIVPDK